MPASALVVADIDGSRTTGPARPAMAVVGGDTDAGSRTVRTARPAIASVMAVVGGRSR